MIRARTVRSVAPASTALSEPTVASATMNIAEAAAYLGISKATLYTWRTRRPGFGPRAVKAGGALRYRLSDLELWIEEHAETLDGDSPKGIGNADNSGRAAPDPATSSKSKRLRPRYTCPRRPAER